MLIKTTFQSLWQGFVRSKAKSSIVLGLAAIFSLILANSTWSEGFFNLLDYRLGGNPLGLHLELSISHWINDGLMAIFFLLVGMEIKRELVEGELSSPRKAMLPIFGALGGMVVPALIYVYFNIGTPAISGWGVPMATDIAFSLAVVSALGSRVPLSVKVFLTALAIVDDLGAILVIALFYTEGLAVDYLLWAAVVVSVLSLLNRLNAKPLWPYLVLGLILWYCIHQSGVHSTIAGVVLAFCIPLGRKEEDGPAESLQHALHKPVSYGVMPLFALANTGFPILAGSLGLLFSPISYGISLGLIFGKPIGITLFSMLGIGMRLASFPNGARWIHFVGAGFLAGIGYTVAIFVALLAFEDEGSRTIAKLSILAASIAAALVGTAVMILAGKGKETIPTQ